MPAEKTVARPPRARKAALPTTPDPVEIAMEAEASGRASGDVARALLEDHRRLIGWQIAGQRAGFVLKVLTAFAGLAVAGVLAVMAWHARRANGLVVEAFLVPPALAAQGSTGEVVARDVLDRLGQIDAEARSLETVRVTDAWTQTSKIQLPETGLSPDDIQRLLRRWLGHETYVSGEVVQTPAGVRLKVRSGVGHTITVDGPADQLPALAERAAEGLFAHARPLNYLELLIRRGDLVAAKALVARVLASSRDPRDRAAAWYAQGVIANIEDRGPDALAAFRQAMKSPDRVRAAQAHGMTSYVEGTLGHPRQAEAAAAEALRLIQGTTAPAGAAREANYRANLLALRNDYAAAEQAMRPFVGQELPGAPPGAFQGSYAVYLINLHRRSEARTPALGLQVMAAARSEDWITAARLADEIAATTKLSPWQQSRRLIVLARVGRLDEAREIAAALPPDCAPCLSARAVLARTGHRRPAGRRCPVRGRGADRSQGQRRHHHLGPRTPGLGPARCGHRRLPGRSQGLAPLGRPAGLVGRSAADQGRPQGRGREVRPGRTLRTQVGPPAPEVGRGSGEARQDRGGAREVAGSGGAGPDNGGAGARPRPAPQADALNVSSGWNAAP
jgi:tetratricopeptide (TPR) repeat protein